MMVDVMRLLRRFVESDEEIYVSGNDDEGNPLPKHNSIWLWRNLVSRSVWVRENAGSNPASQTIMVGLCLWLKQTGCGPVQAGSIPVPHPTR